SVAREPQNSALKSARQVEQVGILQDQKRVTLHEPADLCPPAFQLVPGNVFVWLHAGHDNIRRDNSTVLRARESGEIPLLPRNCETRLERCVSQTPPGGIYLSRERHHVQITLRVDFPRGLFVVPSFHSSV